jgi:hypothetical protein
VALKAICPAQTHKTEAGLLRLNLASGWSVGAAFDELRAGLGDQGMEGILVQKMAGPGIEVLLGIQRDPQFGLVLALGSGGAMVELLADVALGLLPLTPGELSDLLSETRVDRLLAGFRGQPPADRAALIQLVVSCCRLAVTSALPLVSLDLNPVIVHPAGQGVSLVDARIYIEETETCE